MPDVMLPSYNTLMLNLGCDAEDADLLAAVAGFAGQMQATVIGALAYEVAVELGTTITGLGGHSSPQALLDLEIHRAEDCLATGEVNFRVAFDGHPVLWRSTITDKPAADWLARNARAADLVVTRPQEDSFSSSMCRQLDVGDLVMAAGRPVLLIPRHVKKVAVGTVLVGWKDTREAKNAIVAALPLLYRASHVIIAEIAAQSIEQEARERVQDVAAWLGRHGIAAECLVEAPRGADAMQMAALVERVSADVLVAGAYGHSRLHEWALGGVTMDLLMRPCCTTFVAH